jgi:tetratricopeptide (TPR) repeat protein
LLSKRIKISSIICIILSTNIGIDFNAESAQYVKPYRRYYKPPIKPRLFPIKPISKNIARPKKINAFKTPLVILPIPSKSSEPLIDEQKIIEEKVNNLNDSVNQNKKDIISSAEQINKLKSEQNIILSENQELNIKNTNLYNLVIALISILLLSLLIFIFVIFKIRNNTKKTIQDLRNEQIQKSDEIVSERVRDFNNALKDSLKTTSKKSEENNKSSLSDFEKTLSEIIDKYIKDYSAKIDSENNTPEALEVKRYINSISYKEKEISSHIERIHIANTYFNTANTLMKSEYYEDAIEEYQESIKANPSFYGAYLNLGKAYEKIKENDKAIKTYLEAININPDYYKAYFNLACIYFEQKDYDNASENYEQVLKLKPDNYKAYNNLAIINNIKDNKDKAKEYYKKALENNKDYIEAYFNLVILEEEDEKEDNKENSNIYHIVALYTKKYNASTKTIEKVEHLIEEYLKKKEILKK